MKKIRLGISACLLGEKTRYDGGHKLDPYLKYTLGAFVEWLPVCPEVECGLSVPREEMHITGTPGSPRLVTRFSGVDHTDRMLDWSSKKMKELEREAVCGFVFKSRSPSCGVSGVGCASGLNELTCTGLFAREVMKRFPALPVEDDVSIHETAVREDFMRKATALLRQR